MTTVFYDRSRASWRARWVTSDATRHSRRFPTEAEARAFDPERDDTTPRRPGPRSQDVRHRILAAVVIDENGCWIWQGRISNRGYGQLMCRPRPKEKQVNASAHRLSYETFVGPIPAGLQIDHLCFVTTCVNPEHLEPVTAAENVHRRDARKLVSA